MWEGGEYIALVARICTNVCARTKGASDNAGSGVGIGRDTHVWGETTPCILYNPVSA
jgi:hypothetical protein